MHLFPWLLSACLVAQTGGAPPAPLATVQPTTRPTQTIAGGLPPRPTATPTAKSASKADDLVAEAIAPTAGGSLPGEPLPLVSAVAIAQGRAQQLDAIHAYWRLARAFGNYRYCLERQQRLAPLNPAADEASELRAAQARAAARLREAEVDAASAQHELAATLRLAETAPLPLPADRPLTEPYRTRYAELYAGQKPPDRVRMLNDTLPLRQRAVESHAAAVVAAEDLLDAAIELQSKKAVGSGSRDGAPLSAVLQAMDAQVREQQAFLTAVCRYNDDIGEYSLAVVPQQTAPDVLVTTLVRQPRLLAPAFSPATNVPASYRQPAAAPALVVPATGGGLFPTRASAGMQAPVAAPRLMENPAPAAVMAKPQAAVEIAPPADAPNNDEPAPPLAAPQESTVPAVPARPPKSDGARSGASAPRTAFKPVLEQTTANHLPPAAELAIAFHENHVLPVPPGTPVRLVDCLRRAGPTHRLDSIEAYWTARQSAAYCQLLAEDIGRFDALKPALAAEEPPAPLGMLELRRARTAAAAQLADAEADSLTARFQLAVAAGLPTEQPLPQPVSTPFAGHFPIAPRNTAGAAFAGADNSWTARGLAAEIALREQAVGASAAAVIETDAVRAQSTADFSAHRSSIEHVLAAIDAQANEAADFLKGLADYNRAIAHYANARYPMSASPRELAAAVMAAE